MNLILDRSKDEIAKLCHYFETNRKSFFAPGVKEAHVRQSLIDPFFETLGWDVRNASRIAPQYREVVPEDSLDVEGHQKAPDYTFRVGTTPKFYAEAKKCGVNINVDLGPAYQLRRYAYSAKLDLSILTDFEEFSVYECSSRPKPSDKASHSRIQYVRFEEYPDRWKEIWDVFSREAVWAGSFDQYISSKRKKGTSEVDTEFLKDIENWRETLARNIAIRNPSLSVIDLNTAVQRTIDRIIFLRIAEDRGLEPYQQLLKLCEQPNIYRQFISTVCRKADEKYNSGLFHFQNESGIADLPDTITPKLVIDDKILKPIIQSLYFEFGSPYHFGVLPVEILGTVYERFLGKVIRLTAGHQAKVEEKPEVRKAGGVYYTPSYIVDYIVKNTVGKQIEGKSPAQIAKGKDGQPLRVLDIACGSGSFLLGAYQYLLDYCTNWYESNQPEKHTKAIFPDVKGIWRLTISERKRILTTYIFGVDIDRQAVEVTKLSLLIKALEGENDATLTQQMQIFQERALPNLSKNIKCGNSLIGPDYFSETMFPDPEELSRINPFDWKAEFPEAMDAGGFDCVIGNPPWGAEFSEPDEKQLRLRYESAKSSSFDSYAIFIEGALRLLNPGGLLGYITPDTFLRKDNYFALRRYIFENATITELIESGPLFSKVRDTWCLIFILSPKLPTTADKITHRKISRFIVSAEDRLFSFGNGQWESVTEVPQLLWAARPRMIVGYCATEAEQKLIAKIEQYPSLGLQPEMYRISRGEEGSKFAVSADPSGEFLLVIPGDIERYKVGTGINISRSTLTPNKIESYYKHPKLWIIRIQKMRWKQRVVCAFDNRTHSAGMKTLQIVVSPQNNVSNLRYLSAILSSRLINFWCINYLSDDMNQSYLEKIPIPQINSADSVDNEQYLKVTMLVEKMLEFNILKFAAKDVSQKSHLQRLMDSMDKQIDALVYKLYGLTKEEIGIVETATR